MGWKIGGADGTSTEGRRIRTKAAYSLLLVAQALLHANEKHKFVMDLGEGEVIDASERGSILRFVNHSCGPNAETQKWTIQGKRRIGLFATETIEKGTEVCVCSFASTARSS